MNELYDWDKSIELKKHEVDSEGRYATVDVPHEEVINIATRAYDKWNRTQTPIINSMAQQFELRKAATAYKKASISKIGKLNEDKLWAYKLTEDLFQRALIVPDGKNHGILMFVDLSGSMYSNMSGTLDQMMNVAAFCRKVNIPFDVYGFSSNGQGTRNWTEEEKANHWYSLQRKAIDSMEDGTILIDSTHFSLVHMLSSTVSKNEHINAMKYLMVMKMGYDNRQYYNDYAEDEYWGYHRNHHFSLGSTPLNAAVVVGREIAKRFRKRYNIEVLSSIFLTDGAATDSLNYVVQDRYCEDEDKKRTSTVYDESVAIKDGGSTIVLPTNDDYYSRRETVTTTLLEWYKQTTGSRMINFHIIERGQRNSFWNHWSENKWMDKKETSYYPTPAWLANEWKDCLKNKFMMVEDKFGYEQRFLIKGRDNLKIEEKELEVKSNSKGDLMRGFRNFNKGKTSQRLFLNKIIELVA